MYSSTLLVPKLYSSLCDEVDSKLVNQNEVETLLSSIASRNSDNSGLSLREVFAVTLLRNIVSKHCFNKCAQFRHTRNFG